MPIDVSKALGGEVRGGTASWTRDDVILYHLGVGAGARPTDPGELEYAYEKNLKVLPSYGVIPAFRSLAGIANVPGLQFNPALLLHGEQDLEIHRPIPVEATVNTSGKVTAIYDKGKAAVVVLETVSRLTSGGSGDSADPLFTNRFSLFLRGEGGFGGDPGPKAGNVPPEREPDQVVDSPTLSQQALLYRLSGDKNPLHADPEFAKLGGFDVPILHGLCSFGVVCKAVVDSALGGDTSRLARYRVRFSGVVYPGETIQTSLWQEGNQLLIQAKAKERGSLVISNAAVTVRS